MLSPAPSKSRSNNHRLPHTHTLGTGQLRGKREQDQKGDNHIPRNPVSSNCDSHPKEYQTWPTLTKLKYSSHSNPKHKALAPPNTKIPADTDKPEAAQAHRQSTECTQRTVKPKF
ncbi:hypothetical protein, conserved [Eimeria necatrix]|uniref:Uncharacterized protein n=1 Tax=Eimeria necatrix TaxID=51315 RepID=U6MZ24_9EIME|nr:hypothetical protein, conserved [Eimeria necatrix]CDJ67744.1 hypothetical protein, conserved [Eimeria necatrix]